MWSAILGPLKKIAPCHENETIFVLQCFTRDMHHWLTNCADYCEKQNGLTQNYSAQGASEVAGDAITGGEDGLLSLSLSLSVIITQ